MVYGHVIVSTYWLVTTGLPFVDDPFTFGLLTVVVSLEAIFLSAFVMIRQNRADQWSQVIVDQEWELTQVQWTEDNESLAPSVRRKARRARPCDLRPCFAHYGR